jgi:DNA-binding NarL/FixJ family response regulator
VRKARAERGDHGKIRVLLVDDSQPFRRELKQLLSTLDRVQVVGEAGTGRQGVDLVLDLRPDVVLMDQNMPGISGVSATRRIKAKLPRTRVLFLAA